LVSKFHLVMK